MSFKLYRDKYLHVQGRMTGRPVTLRVTDLSFEAIRDYLIERRLAGYQEPGDHVRWRWVLAIGSMQWRSKERRVEINSGYHLLHLEDPS